MVADKLPCAAISYHQRLFPLQQITSVEGSISAIFWTAVTASEVARKRWALPAE
jgi:hypothetical protein